VASTAPPVNRSKRTILEAENDNAQFGRSYAEIIVTGTPARSASSRWLMPAFSRANCKSADDGDGSPSTSSGRLITQSYYATGTLAACRLATENTPASPPAPLDRRLALAARSRPVERR
jgi:hypothetical protein